MIEMSLDAFHLGFDMIAQGLCHFQMVPGDIQIHVALLICCRMGLSECPVATPALVCERRSSGRMGQVRTSIVLIWVYACVDGKTQLPGTRDTSTPCAARRECRSCHAAGLAVAYLQVAFPSGRG